MNVQHAAKRYYTLEELRALPKEELDEILSNNPEVAGYIFKGKKNALFPYIIAELVKMGEYGFYVSSYPTFLLGGRPYIIKTQHLHSTFEDGVEVIAEEIAALMKDANADGQTLALYDIHPSVFSTSPQGHATKIGVMLRFARVILEDREKYETF